MAIKKKPIRRGKLEIDITGPEGNAFVLLAYAEQFARQCKLDSKAIQEEMKSGDYENLLSVFDKYFGDLVDLLR